jgi:hypothetical protein
MWEDLVGRKLTRAERRDLLTHPAAEELAETEPNLLRAAGRLALRKGPEGELLPSEWLRMRREARSNMPNVGRSATYFAPEGGLEERLTPGYQGIVDYTKKPRHY